MGPDMKKKFFGDTFFNSTTYLAFHVGLCVWSTFSPPSHQAISNLSTDLDSLVPGRGNKTICKVMGREIKKNIYYWRHLFSLFYLPSISSPFVCLINFFPPSHQAISNLSTDLDSLVPGGGNKTICNVMGQEIKKKYYLRHHFSFFYLPSTSSPFVCLINFFNPFPPSYFKSKHRFRILGLRRI